MLFLYVSFSFIDKYFLIPAEIFNSIVELVIPIKMPSKEAKAEVVEAKIRKCSM